MKLLTFFQRRKTVRGEIGYYELENWWSKGLTDQERARILEVFPPLGAGKRSLTETNIVESSESKMAFLTNLAAWFKKDDDRPIAYKILAKAETFVSVWPNVLDKHFFFQEKIEMNYRDREKPVHLAECELACRSQIALAGLAALEFAKESPDDLPEHIGYKQLTTILANRGDTGEAVSLARQAQSQRWAGDWSRRIERYSPK